LGRPTPAGPDRIKPTAPATEAPLRVGGEKEPEEPIRLVGDEEPSTHALRAFGDASLAAAKKAEFKRHPNVNGTGAVRCRVFHSRIQVSSLEYMEGQINEWLDHEQVEVKHVGHVIGIMEGKRPEPNLIVTVWY